MLRALRWVAIALGAAVGAILLTLLAARFHDGPIGPFSGGAFSAGNSSETPADWSFAADASTLELELPPDVGRSITTGLAVADGRLYINCLFASSKLWPPAVVRDGRVRVRIAGKIYALRAARVEDAETLARVGPMLAAKYGFTPDRYGDRDWMFALSAR
ncbi:MAG: hypothetical protein ACHQ6T_09320 [Myxococcota bacterium]